MPTVLLSNELGLPRDARITIGDMANGDLSSSGGILGVLDVSLGTD